MVNISLDKLKKMGSDLVDSVKSGEMLDKVKASVESVTQSKSVILPSEISGKVTEIQAQLKALQEAQFAQQKAADTLYNSISAFSKEVVALCEKTCCLSEKAGDKADCCAEDKKDKA